ncbi:MAG TPA: hypothetical protein VGJ37_08365 [Pyrinomonadaceae bacterium]
MTDLFENFEVNRDSRWAILSRLIGASLVLHLVFLWLVIYVPALRDTLNIAALIASTKFVEKDYVGTQIGDEVQLVQLTNEKFHYPEGYFALEAQIAGQLPGQAAANDPFAPKIISQWNSKEPDPEHTPSPSPEASASPKASPSASPAASAVAQASPSPNANSNTQLSAEQAQKKLEETAAENKLSLPEENQINKKVLKDFAAYANDLKNQNKLDLNKPFEVVIEAELDEKGKLKNPRFTKKAGDENLVDLFGRMVAALNDSGFLIYLQPISKDNPGAKVVITIKQGENEVLASVASETSSTTRAETLAKVLNTMLVLGADSRAGKDEEVIMKNTSATPDGKRVLVNFSMPRQSVVDMIKRQLEPGV